LKYGRNEYLRSLTQY